jgi:hypothetical protein
VNPGHIPRRIATYVKKLVILGTGAVALSLVGAGTAGADDGVVGHTFSDANSPGFSAASPEGRASQAVEQQVAAKQAAQAQAEQDELAAADAQQGGG